MRTNGIKGYYLDKNESLYKKCFDSCESCEMKGDNTSHNCLKCNVGFPFSIQNFINNYTNCYNTCTYYHYFDNDNFYRCTKNFSCPDDFPILIKNKSECFAKIINSYESDFEKVYENFSSLKSENIQKELSSEIINEKNLKILQII